MSVGSGFAGALRREIVARSRRRLEQEAIAGATSHGPGEAVVYAAAEDGASHGNFFPASYAAIVGDPQWRSRLKKVHSGRRNLPRQEKWRELDACTSSDALLMNVFCHPRTAAEGKLQRLMTVDRQARPEFGVRVAAPLKNGQRDRTEVDMRIGDLLVEAKLTETDFQCCAPAMVERYAEFEELFGVSRLPRRNEGYAGYQLIRSVLAAKASGARFCVIADARRPDLREQWFAVMRAVGDAEMRLRCQMLTWQEVSAALPRELRGWLGEKYGIFAPGEEPEMDASEWYW